MESIPRVYVHQSFSTIFVLTVCAQNFCGLFLEDVSKFIFFLKRKEFVGPFVKNPPVDHAFMLFAFVNGQEKFDPSLWKPFLFLPF